MPGSIPNPLFYFPAKVAIYSLAGWIANRVYGNGPNPFLFGVLRVGIGFAVGLFLLIVFGPLTGDYVWLLCTRLFVWAGIIWFFFERNEGLSPIRFLIVVALGVLLSFGIDAAFSWLDSEFAGRLSIPMC